MKKAFFLLVFIGAFLLVMAQIATNPRIKYSDASTPYRWRWGIYEQGLGIPYGPEAKINENSADSLRPGRIFFETPGIGLGGTLKIWDGLTFTEIEGGGSYDSLIDGSRVSTSSIPELNGRVPGFTTIREAIEEIYYPSQFPTLSLSGGAVEEVMATGANISKTVNWIAGRLGKTTDLDTIKINGVNITFTNPAAPGTVSGSVSASIPRNVTTVVSGYVRTVDNKITSASTTFSFTFPRYVLWISDTTGISSGALDDDIILGTKDLSSSRVKTYNTGAPTGTQYPIYVYIATAGALTSLKMNGFESLGAWKTVTRTITTSGGYTGSFRIYWGSNGQTSASNIETL